MAHRTDGEHQRRRNLADAATGHPVARLLPWRTEDGRPCYLLTDDNRLATVVDQIESVQLGMGRGVLGHARKMLSADGLGPDLSADELQPARQPSDRVPGRHPPRRRVTQSSPARRHRVSRKRSAPRCGYCDARGHLLKRRLPVVPQRGQGMECGGPGIVPARPLS